MSQHLKILVVDDDTNIVDVLVTYLVDRGYSVEARKNGREALDALRDGDFGLIISDGKMAEMDGFEFISIARENYPDIAIILMTAHEDRYPLSEALNAGADGYVTKPFSLRKISLILDRTYWAALGREDWWDRFAGESDEPNDGT